MSTLSQAPLIEAVFELRWGNVTQTEDTQVTFEYDEDNDVHFFPGQFKKVASDHGYSHVQKISPSANPIPFQIYNRFRKQKDSWPCYQIGLGIFTVNQINEDYDWEPFKKSILEGCKLLDKGHPQGIQNLPPFRMELRNIDGLVLNEDELPLELIKERLQINFSPPTKLLNHSQLEELSLEANLSFSMRTKTPPGLLIFRLQPGNINGQRGLVATIVVQSNKEGSPKFSLESIENWLNEAHQIQRDVFSILIEPSYLEKLK